MKPFSLVTENPARRQRLTVLGNGECLSCDKRYQLPTDSAGKRYVCKFCGGLVVASLTGPVFQKEPAPPQRHSREGDRRAHRGKSRLIRLPARSWWPLLILWSAAAVMVLLLGNYAWRTSLRPIDASKELALAAPPVSRDLIPLFERGREHDHEARPVAPRRDVPATPPQKTAGVAPIDRPAAVDPPAEGKASGDGEPLPITVERPVDSVPSTAPPPDPRVTSRKVPEDGPADPPGGPGLFPFTFSLTDIDGKKLDLKALKGKVVIVDLWGTWCPPCRQEIPNFVRLKKTYGGDGLEIVGLNFERAVKSRRDAIWLVKRMHAQLKMNYRCALGTEEIEQQVPNLRGFPTTLILDRDGEVRFQLVGYRSFEELEGIVVPLLSPRGSGTHKKSDPERNERPEFS
jgi:thiol-disulfide isomerase/thioredoxin